MARISIFVMLVSILHELIPWKRAFAQAPQGLSFIGALSLRAQKISMRLVFAVNEVSSGTASFSQRRKV
jgi:hypothetical protein